MSAKAVTSVPARPADPDAGTTSIREDRQCGSMSPCASASRSRARDRAASSALPARRWQSWRHRSSTHGTASSNARSSSRSSMRGQRAGDSAQRGRRDPGGPRPRDHRLAHLVGARAPRPRPGEIRRPLRLHVPPRGSAHTRRALDGRDACRPDDPGSGMVASRIRCASVGDRRRGLHLAARDGAIHPPSRRRHRTRDRARVSYDTAAATSAPCWASCRRPAPRAS